jgi:hypothetical protein
MLADASSADHITMRPPKRAKGPLQSKVRRQKAATTQARLKRAAQALLVLGMHRSGTSALTRVLGLLGADLPKNLMPPDHLNEAGYWESMDLYAAHDDLLATAGSCWDDWRKFNPDWNQSGIAKVYKERLIRVLQNDFDGSPLFVIKDPRICRFVPLWLDVLDRFGAQVRIIIIVRNPLEVAASLKHRNNLPHAKSCLIWLRHVLDAEKATRQLPRAIVTYHDLLDDWRTLVGTVAAKTRIHWPRRSDHSELEIDQFVANTLRHHAADFAQVAERGDVADWVKETYRLLLDMAGNRESNGQFKRLDRIHSEFDKACASFGLVLAGEADQSEAQLRSAQTQIKTRDDEVARLSRELSQAQSATNDAELSVATLAADLEGARATARDRAGAVGQLASALEKEKAAATQRNVLAASLGQELEALRTAVTEHDAAATKLRASLDIAQLAANDRENAIQRLSRELISAQSTVRDRDRQIEQLLDAANAIVTFRIGDLEQRLETAREEKDRLIAELARMAAEVQHTQQRAADQAAALEAVRTESNHRAASQIRAIRDQLVDAEAALAKSKAEQGRRLWRTLFFPAPNTRRAERQLMKSGLFDPEWYIREYPNVVKSGRSPAQHYLEEGYLRAYRPNPLFDTRWYLEHYDDVRRSGINPALHYLSLGWVEGRDPGPDFQTNFYILAYPDVRTSGENPLAHYLRCGRADGRVPLKPRAGS